METQKTNGFGIASLVLGIIGILLSCIAFGIFPSVVGLILAVAGLVVKNRKKGLAIAGLICSIIGIVLFLVASSFVNSLFSDSDSSNNKAQKVDSVSQSNESNDTPDTQKPEEPQSEEQETEIDNKFVVGDVVETDNLRITFVSSSSYISDNQFIQPKDGYEYWEFEFRFENISDKDQSVSSMMDWECYADNTKVDQSWIGDDNGLDATLSSGRATQGKIYFEVPVNATDIEVEYDINFWKSDKIIFIGK